MIIKCSDCNTAYEVEAIASYEVYNEYDPSDGQKYFLFKCPGCSQPILTKSILFWGPLGGFEWDNSMTIFPISQFHINSAIPKELGNALAESIQCYNASLYTPTVIMCRRILEGFCQLMGVGKNVSLVKALAELKEKEIINSQLYQWATLLRDSGNKAAHDINSTFTHSDAKDILDFTIAILDFTYSFKEKFDNFIKRQGDKNQ